MDKEKIIKVIEQCYDPEIPVDLWNLGLIYNIDYKLNEKNKYNVHLFEKEKDIFLGASGLLNPFVKFILII